MEDTLTQKLWSRAGNSFNRSLKKHLTLGQKRKECLTFAANPTFRIPCKSVRGAWSHFQFYKDDVISLIGARVQRGRPGLTFMFEVVSTASNRSISEVKHVELTFNQATFLLKPDFDGLFTQITGISYFAICHEDSKDENKVVKSRAIRKNTTVPANQFATPREIERSPDWGTW